MICCMSSIASYVQFLVITIICVVFQIILPQNFQRLTYSNYFVCRAEEEDVSLPSSATSSTARSQRSSKQSAKGFHPPNITSKDKRAVEKVSF